MGSDYDVDIAQGVDYWQWLKIKIVKKLFKKNTETNKVPDGYNSSNNYFHIWKCHIHNINFLKKHAKLDIYGDDTSWVTASYGEYGDGITFPIYDKSGITNGGGQIVLVSDVHHTRPCAYRHRHKFHEKPPGCNLWV